MAQVVPLKKRKLTPTQADSREELVEIAIDLFATRGYAGTSIRDIAEAVGRSVSNIYHYFENKEALWFAIYERSVKTLPGQLRASLEGLTDPRERFAALVRQHLEVTEFRRREARIFFIDEERLSPAGNRIHRRMQREILGIYLAELENLETHGLIDVADLKVAALNTLGVISWYLRWSKPGVGAAKRRRTIDELVTYILRGLGCDVGTRSPAS